MDVLVNKQLKLQMSSPIDSGRQLRVRSSTVCWTSCFATETGTHCANRAADWRFHSAVLCWLLPRPLLCNDRCLVDARVNMLDKFQQFSAREGAQTKGSEEGSLPFLRAFFALRPFGRRGPLVRTFWGALDGQEFLVVEGSG